MLKKIDRPQDHYSKDWNEYWKQNPHLHRGVGAEAAPSDPPADPPADPPTAITPEQFNALQKAMDEQKSQLEKLEANNRSLLQEKKDAKTAAEKAAEEAARKSGDVEALEKSWREKLENETKERDSKLSEYQQMINKMTIGTQAQKLASDLAVPGSADVLLPHIERRLEVELKDGQPIIRVLDKDGKPSALSVDDLRKEIEGNPAFAPLISGSKASGSGGVGNKGNSSVKTMKRSDFDALSPAEQDSFILDGGKPVDA